MTSQILHTLEQKRVKFDPTNEEHLEAFKMLCIGTTTHGGPGMLRQHPHLRFVLEDGFGDIRHMMLYKVGKQYLTVVRALDRAVA